MLPFNLAPRLDTVSRGQQGIPFRSTNGTAAPGEVWAAARQTGPRRAAPLVLLYAVFATHPQRGEYSRPPLAPAVIAPQHRRPRGEGWRVPQGSPASPWEGVSKFHYPPRCRRARPATAGSKVRVDRCIYRIKLASCTENFRQVAGENLPPRRKGPPVMGSASRSGWQSVGSVIVVGNRDAILGQNSLQQLSAFQVKV